MVFLLDLRVLGTQAGLPWWSVIAKAPRKACKGEVSALLKEGEGGANGSSLPMKARPFLYNDRLWPVWTECP